MTTTYRGYNLDITITRSPIHGGQIFDGVIISKKGKPLAGGVCGRVAEDGRLFDVRHVGATGGARSI